MSFRGDTLDAEDEWNQHRTKCRICRRHVSIEGYIIREKQMCKKGRDLARAAWAMADAAAEMGIE